LCLFNIDHGLEMCRSGYLSAMLFEESVRVTNFGQTLANWQFPGSNPAATGMK
jgi:hypothetical protein